jgi:predicted NAD/FAD-binding protein
MRIAVVGAGVSGLTAAYLLHGDHEITVFEADNYIGGHASTMRVDTANETHHLDTGFMVFNDRNYPNFERLVRRLGVASQPSDMSFSVSDADGTFEYASTSVNALFADREHLLSLSFQRMLAEIPRFQRAARALLRDGDERTSLRDWLAEHGFSSSFVERLVVPQVAAVWSANPEQLWTFPAMFLARFFENHGMLTLRGRPRWRTISGGSATYVAEMARGFRERIQFSSPVEEIRRSNDGVEVTVRGRDAEHFDQVIMATHADQALAILADASTSEHEILDSIPYQQNEVVLHTDPGMLPRRRRAWASWNYRLLEKAGSRATITYHLNRLQNLVSEQQFCVTLNMTERIDPARVLHRVVYSHPVYTPAGVVAQRRVSEISGRDRTHFCGAYWGWGFHEDGVTSGLRVAEALGGRL